MIDRFFLHISTLIRPSDKVLLAVSGGIDSVVMLHLFKQTSYNVSIAHCNFQLRGKDADEDENFVKQLALHYDIPFYSVRFDTQGYAEKCGISIQMAARELRYDWFHSLMREIQYDCIATAHQRDDVLETFFINMLRKTGIKGLCGIKEKNEHIIRPILRFSRQEIIAYADQFGLAYREDKSNEDDYYRRNYIRHHILPKLKQMQANYDDVLHETIEILQQQEAIYSQHIKEVEAEMMTENDAVYTIDIQKLKQLNNLTTYLYEFISPFGFNRTQTENIVDILDNESGKMFYSSAYCLLKDRNSIQIKSIEKQAAFIVIEDRFANNKMQEYRLLLERLPYCQGFEIEDRTEVAYFDADKIEFPLLVRKWKEGDVFFPFGMKGSKKLSDFFIDNKMSLFEKQEIDLLCNGNGDILWVIGKRSDNRYRLTTSSKTALKITYY